MICARRRSERRACVDNMKKGLTCLALLAVGAQAAEQRFTTELWTDLRPIYERSLQHPFLKGVADGSLPRSRFQFHLVQDAHYLLAFSRVLSLLAARRLERTGRSP